MAGVIEQAKQVGQEITSGMKREESKEPSYICLCGQECTCEGCPFGGKRVSSEHQCCCGGRGDCSCKSCTSKSGKASEINMASCCCGENCTCESCPVLSHGSREDVCCYQGKTHKLRDIQYVYQKAQEVGVV